ASGAVEVFVCGRLACAVRPEVDWMPSDDLSMSDGSVRTVGPNHGSRGHRVPCRMRRTPFSRRASSDPGIAIRIPFARSIDSPLCATYADRADRRAAVRRLARLHLQAAENSDPAADGLRALRPPHAPIPCC